MEKIPEIVSESKELLNDMRVLTGDNKFVAAAEAMEKINRNLEEINQFDFATGNPDIDDGLLLDELDWVLPEDFVVDELKAVQNSNTCFCDDKRDQFDLEERLLGDEADPPRPELGDRPLEEYFAL